MQSVKTLGSGDTLNNEVLSHKLCDFEEKHDLQVVQPETLPRSISGTKAKLVLLPSLPRDEIDISQININLRYGKKPSWCKEKGIIELPKAVRKDCP